VAKNVNTRNTSVKNYHRSHDHRNAGRGFGKKAVEGATGKKVFYRNGMSLTERYVLLLITPESATYPYAIALQDYNAVVIDDFPVHIVSGERIGPSPNDSSTIRIYFWLVVQVTRES
jgi:hypothetical protein